MKVRLSIKNKLIIYFGTLMIVGFVISGFMISIVCHRVIESEVMENTTQLVMDRAEKISIILNHKTTHMEQLLEFEELRDGTRGVAEKLQLLEEMNRFIGFEDIVLVDIEGQAQSIKGYALDLSHAPEFLRASQGTISYSKAIAHKGNVYFTISIPIMNESQEVIAVIMGVETANSFAYLFEAQGERDEILIIDSDASVVLHSNDRHVKEQITVAEMEENPAYRDVYELYRRMLQGETGAMKCMSPVTGISNYVAYTPIGMGWSIALVRYYDDMAIELRVLYQKIWGMATGVIILVLMGVYFLAKRLSRRMISLHTYVDQVAQGDFQRSIPQELLELGDEMGDTARALKLMKSELESMLEAIKESTDYINEQMEDLTIEVKEELKEILRAEEGHNLEKEEVMKQFARLEVLNRQIKDLEASPTKKAE